MRSYEPHISYQALQHQPFYDSCPFADDMRFFELALGNSEMLSGGRLRTKTFADTNMYYSRVLPHPQRFRIEQLQFDVTGTDHFRDNVKQRGHLELIVGNRTWLHIAPLGLLMPQTRYKLEPSYPITHAHFDYNTPIWVNVRTDMKSSENRAFVYLIGTFERPEQ